jgi:hypothetical protein
MNSLKQVIVNAVIKVSSDPAYKGREYETPDDARVDFIKALIAELFPECPECVLPSDAQSSESVVVVVEHDGGGEPAKEKKKRAPKKKAEEPAAAGSGSESETVKEKKKPGPKPKAKEEPAAAGSVEEKKKPGRKPKPAAEGPVNLEKFNPTQQKKFKSVAEELKVEADKKAFHDYLNGLSKEDYNAKTFEEHARGFLSPPATTSEAQTKCARVEWPEGSGQIYFVDPETKKVYETQGSVDVMVGHMGMLQFEGMELPVA